MGKNPFKIEKSAPERPLKEQEAMPGAKELAQETKGLDMEIREKEQAFEDEEGVKTIVKERLRALQKMPAFALPRAKRDEVDEIIQFPVSQQVGALISLVFEQGLEQAIATAKALNNPAILDELHDTLVDQYWEQLVDKDIIKP